MIGNTTIEAFSAAGVSTVDLIVIVIYLALCLAVGIWVSIWESGLFFLFSWVYICIYLISTMYIKSSIHCKISAYFYKYNAHNCAGAIVAVIVW